LFGLVDELRIAMQIFVIETTRPQYAKIEVYELDHETEHYLFFKVRGSVVRKNKVAFGFRWGRTEEEIGVVWREWADREIARHENELALLRSVDHLEIHPIPPDLMKVVPGKLIL
jgi:hypothetical protein